MKKLIYKLKSGKNTKLFYYINNILFYIVSPLNPKITDRKIERTLKGYSTQQQDYIKDRVNYYCKLAQRGTPTQLPPEATTLSQHRYKKVKCASVYFFDTYIYTIKFKQDLKWCHLFGDIIHVPDYPSIVKSRPLCDNNINSVVMKLDKIRHFTFVNDKKKFCDKQNIAIFRGDIANKNNRIDFMRKHSSNPMVDAGCVDRNENLPTEWKRELITIKNHLDYKFIIALEGNDVASNLKWIMSSNSVAVMPKPTCETWFMEGKLQPNYHYIEIADDFSDLTERLQYYIDNPHKAEAIARNANNYVKQFRNKKQEELISLMVMQQYFKYTI